MWNADRGTQIKPSLQGRAIQNCKLKAVDQGIKLRDIKQSQDPMLEELDRS